MKKYSRIFNYIGQYKGDILLYFIFIILSIIFSIVSIGMLLPFLDLIFKGESSSGTLPFHPSNNIIIDFIRSFLGDFIAREGKIATLGLICLLIIVSILFKNLFLVLSYYILNPLKNKVVNRLRADLYNKILQLPIGYFTEKRKGDLI